MDKSNLEEYIDDIPKLGTNKVFRRLILKKHLGKIIIFTLLLAVGGYILASFKNPALLGPLQGFKIGPVSLPVVDPNAEQKMVIEKVGKLMRLPGNETPTVATIVDITKLPAQPFFKDAKNGDQLLIFPVSKTAILYDPNVNQIIQVGPLVNNSTSSQQPQNQARIAIKNGTNVPGLASKVESEIKSSFPSADIVSKDNAVGSDYAHTIVVVLNDGAKDAADSLAKSINATVSGLPSQETKPSGVEILVIIGKDQI